MMSTNVGAAMPQYQYSPQHYQNDLTMDELSRQLAFSDSMRRISRSSNGQRTPGAMRVVKPSSASNSPQALMARRRTLMNDGNSTRRRQQAWDQALYQQMQQNTSPGFTTADPMKRSTRPVSWHPGSQPATQFQGPQMHMHLPQPDFTQYAMPAPVPYQQPDLWSGYQNLPPTPAAYSGHTSPVCNLSPMSLPFAASQPQALPSYVTADRWDATPFTSSYFDSNASSGMTAPFSNYCDSQPSVDWNTYGSQGLHSCTAPPTPDEIQPMQQPQPAVAPDESIPYEPLEEPEEEGEVLVGMGLYDPPSKTDEDPELGNYHASTSQLLGTTYRTGKGWKLEEAWEPPASDDEDSEDDAQGEDQEEENETTASPPAQQSWI
ncbi:hypothetical protein F4780DRAFT_594994 [Xylariomycetidae sp. FL0641]|nr:hypothetical protein F4780DRAFT_594994 [Xylariomycetidae sp. FL0641]